MKFDCFNSTIFEELSSSYMPKRINIAINGIEKDKLSQLEEIRIRSDLPLMGVFAESDKFIGYDGLLTECRDNALIVSAKEVNELFYLMCEQSVYAYQEDIKRGFITLKGGHRAGICGTVIYEGDQIIGMRDISSVNIRLSHQLKGCANEVVKSVIRNERDIFNTLILSPPRCGKTTLLRDLCRLISQGIPSIKFRGIRTAVIDERSELAAVYRGTPQNDLGPRTDILDGCHKCEGIWMMLRGMAPDVIVVDELGGAKDADSVRMAWNAGVRLIATAHAFGIDDFKARYVVGQLASTDGFERILLLGMDNGRRWVKVMDSYGNQLELLYQNSGLSYGFCRMHSNGA